jgi:hypothetical protein
MTADEFSALALSVDGSEPGAHFGKRDFRLGGKIFASLPADAVANLKLTPDQQMMMIEMQPTLFAVLPNAWGARGWTALGLEKADGDTVRTALAFAAGNVAPRPRSRKSRE